LTICWLKQHSFGKALGRFGGKLARCSDLLAAFNDQFPKRAHKAMAIGPDNRNKLEGIRSPAAPNPQFSCADPQLSCADL
jgi:hypothetical protein